jgi:hypothetical protein
MRTVERRLPALALAGLAIATFVGFLYYPTFPNYDSYYSLLWGREVLDGIAPSFEAYRAPTEHPLAIAFGALLSLVGDDADRLMVFFTLASFVALCAGMYRLGRTLFTPWVGLAAAGLLCTRFDFPFLAARGYIDTPFLAIVIWAAALEVERPRRGGAVWVLLAAAALLRPEAWLLNGLYFLWMSWRAGWAQRLRYAALAAIGPATWVLVDWAVTGQPLFSLQHTSGLAEELGRTKGLSEVPSAMRQFFFNLTKGPVVYAGILGFLLAVWLTPKRLGMPVALWLIGVGTFVMVGIAGLSVIDRYLLIPSLMVMLFAAIAVAGWSLLREDSRWRRPWMVGAALIIAYGVVFTAMKVNFSTFDKELRLRGDSHASLEQILRDPRVQAGRRCGPVSVPNHKLVPDVRWVLDAGEGDVIARSDSHSDRRKLRGVALYVTERAALLRQALVADTDDPFDSIPMDGFTRVATSDHYGAYVRC